MPISRRPLALVLVLALVGAAACAGETPVGVDKTPKPKTSTKPKATPTPTPSPKATPSDDTATKVSPSPTGGSPSPSPSGGSPKPSTSPVASTSPSPVVGVSAPPIVFPYTKVGAKWVYTMTIKLALGSAGGEATLLVKTVTDKDATLDTTFVIKTAPPGTPGLNTPTTKAATIAKASGNPFALGTIFPKAGVEVKTTVTAVVKEKLKLASGEVDATKYTIKETNGPDTADVTLWTAVSDGAMLKQEIKSKKPPSLLDLGAAAAFITGDVTTTLELKEQSGGTASADPNASGAASPAPCPSGTPAGGTSTGLAAHGDYKDKTLPTKWDTERATEAAVTTSITAIANDANTDASGADTWARFKCFYGPAVAVWRTKTSRTD